MNIPDYTSVDLLRIELLRYPTPANMHPMEAAWRDTARKLLVHCEALQEELLAYYAPCEFKPFKFPQKAP